MRTRQQRTGQREQKNWAQEFWRRTAGKGKPGQDSRDRTAGEDSWDGTGRTRKRGQDGRNMTDEQGSWARTTEIV
jgi:hypothetical protein